MPPSPAHALFPPILPYRSGILAVDDLHTLYWEECGNPEGEPVLFLHGGPGGEASPASRQFFNPVHYRIVLFDQRGAGRSRPLGETRSNTTQHLVRDIEQLRTMLGIRKWLVSGGSWGSCLALAYGEAHPEACSGFILRGVLLGTQAEIGWFLNGIRHFFPEAHEKFVGWMPEDARTNPLATYLEVLFGNDPLAAMQAAQCWVRYARSCASLVPNAEAIASSASESSFGEGRLHAHYCAHHMFLEEDQLLRDLGRVTHLPARIVQGRHDMLCPPLAAHRLHRAWPGAILHIVQDAGHAPSDPGLRDALVQATEAFRCDERR